MTRQKTTWLAGLVLGFTFGGTAVAQSPDTTQPEEETPASPPTTTETPAQDPVDVDVDVDTTTPAPTTTTPDVYVAPDMPDTTVTETDSDYYEDKPYGFAISAGGGTGGFTNDALRGTTDVGGEWGVRLTFGTRSPIAVEASYIGSAQTIDALGLDSSAILVGNGVQAALRLNTTIDFPVQPFIFAGAAWRRYDLTNTDFNTSDLSDSDNVFEIPLGVGIAGKFQGLMLDLRGEFRPTLDNDLLPEIAGADDEPLSDVGNDNFSAMHRWGVNASVGYEF
jgi:hypothetical protein